MTILTLVKILLINNDEFGAICLVALLAASIFALLELETSEADFLRIKALPILSLASTTEKMRLCYIL